MSKTQQPWWTSSPKEVESSIPLTFIVSPTVTLAACQGAVEDSLESPGEIYQPSAFLENDDGMRPLVAHCHLGLGKLYHRTDKREQAREPRRRCIARWA
jgi:hypothetical protein